MYSAGHGLPKGIHEEGKLGFVIEEGLEDISKSESTTRVFDIKADKSRGGSGGGCADGADIFFSTSRVKSELARTTLEEY